MCINANHYLYKPEKYEKYANKVFYSFEPGSVIQL